MKRKKEMISITVGQEVHNAFREYSLKKVDFSHSYNKKIKMTIDFGRFVKNV